MLLAVDIGNSQTVYGVFRREGQPLKAWRVSTKSEQTGDERLVEISDLLALAGLGSSDVTAVAVASVVPSATEAFCAMVREYLALEPLVVGVGTDHGLKIGYRNPQEIGADRLANSVAGFALFGGPLVIVDFGTATTFDVVSADREYVGGVIAPGVETSAGALYRSAAKLSPVALEAPEAVVGRTTTEAIQSGVVLGAACMVDGIVGRIGDELGIDPKVAATGGLAPLVAPLAKTPMTVEPMLTLLGLEMIYERVEGRG